MRYFISILFFAEFFLDKYSFMLGTSREDLHPYPMSSEETF